MILPTLFRPSPLAPWFEQAIGVDADREMLAGAARQAAQAKIKNVQ
jgi:hypothetical protein